VEIRAYPIFFAISCVQTVIFTKLMADRNRADVKLLALFALTCLMAIYTHLYGVVSSSTFFLVLGLAYIKSPAALARLILAFVVVVVGSVGILPFILAAVNRSGLVPGLRTDRHLVYLFRLYGDSANVVSLTAATLFFGGILALLGAA